MYRTYDLKLTTDIPAAPAIWHRPYRGPRMKVFMVPSVHFGRELAELMGKMDLDVGNVTIDRAWDLNKWGFGDYYDKRGAIDDSGIMMENLESAVCSDEAYDVLIIPSVNGWAEFTERTRRAIADRVAAGAGLVLVYPFDGRGKPKTPELAALSPLTALCQLGTQEDGAPIFAADALLRDRWIPAEHYITRGIPFEILPYDILGYYPCVAQGEVIVASESGNPIVAVREYGRGRVVAVGYYPADLLPQHADFLGGDACFNPIMDDWHGARHDKDFDFIDYLYRLAARCVVWAGRREPGPAIHGAGFARDTLTVRADGPTRLIVRDAYDHVLVDQEDAEGVYPVPERLRSGGDFRADWILPGEGMTCDAYTLPFAYPCVTRVTAITLDREVASAGEECVATIRTAGAPCEVAVEHWDGLGQLLRRDTYPAAPEIRHAFIVEPLRSVYLYLRVSLIIDGRAVHSTRTPNLIITPQKRTLDDFEVYMSPQNRGMGKHLHWINKLFPEMGATGNFIGDNRLVAMSGGHGLGIYWYHRHPYVENKERFLRTRDKKYLVRTPCLNDESFWSGNHEAVMRSVSLRRKYGPIAYFAQDEGSLTCYTDELELCYCPRCMERMRTWLKEQYPSLGALNASWNTEYGDWEDAVPLTTMEARQSGDYASWGDHRLFMEMTYANGYKNFRDMITACDPQGRVRMSGCQSSTPFSGNDYALLHRYVRYFEAYPGGNQYEYHRSFKAPDTMLGGWFGYGASGMSVQNRIWYALFHGLTLISIFWEYACLNPDFTFSESAAHMGRAFKEIKRTGIGKLLLYGAHEDDISVAVHYSMPSVHGTYIVGQERKFIDNRQGWLDMLEDLGYPYRFVATQQIEEGELIARGYRVLILPYSIAVSDAEDVAIRAFVAAGGRVLADIQTGMMDHHCKAGTCGRLDDLFGIERLTPFCEPFYVNGSFIGVEDFPYPITEMIRSRRVRARDALGVSFEEAGLRVNGGKAAFVNGFSRHIPAVVLRDEGPGMTCYLNIAMARYPRLRREGKGGEPIRALMDAVLRILDARKSVSLFRPDGAPYGAGIETFAYRGGTARVIGLLRQMDEQKVGNYDGLVLGQAKDASGDAHQVTVKLSNPAHVVDIRTRAYHGYRQEVDVAVAEGDAVLLALLPEKPGTLLLKAPQAVSPGETVAVRASLEGMHGPTVFSVNIYDPQGVYQPFYSENLIGEDGICRHDIRLPLNAAMGRWRITVGVPTAGQIAEAQVDVR